MSKLSKISEEKIMKKITDPRRIIELANIGKSVVCSNPSNKPQPAAFVQNYQFHYLMTLIMAGKVYEYQVKQK